MIRSDGTRCVGIVRIGDLVRTVAARHAAEVVDCPSDDDVVVAGCRSMLEQVFDDLCANVVGAAANRIRIAVQSLGAEVAVHVEADGIGARGEHVGRDHAGVGPLRGLAGFGLHAVATRLLAQGGHLRCVAFARGTRFSVTLPAVGMRTTSHG